MTLAMAMRAGSCSAAEGWQGMAILHLASPTQLMTEGASQDYMSPFYMLL